MNTYMSYLAHHGILGQKWGVRRFQNSDGTWTDEGKKRYGSNSASSRAKGESYVNSIGGQKVSDLVGGSGNSNAVTAVTTVVSILAPFPIRQISNKIIEKSLRNNCMKQLDELYQNREIKNFNEAPKLSSKMKAEESMKLVNPDYPDVGTTMNCTFCTSAMALREMGYDVKATKLKNDTGMHTEDYFGKTFNSETIQMKGVKSAADILRTLQQNGDGAYGNLSVTWKLGGGHSIFWKNEDGKTHIYDGQSGEEVTSSDESYKKFMSSVNLRSTLYSRLDNCTPTDYALAAVEKYGEPHKSKENGS